MTDTNIPAPLPTKQRVPRPLTPAQAEQVATKKAELERTVAAKFERAFGGAAPAKSTGKTAKQNTTAWSPS